MRLAAKSVCPSVRLLLAEGFESIPEREKTFWKLTKQTTNKQQTNNRHSNNSKSGRSRQYTMWRVAIQKKFSTIFFNLKGSSQNQNVMQFITQDLPLLAKLNPQTKFISTTDEKIPNCIIFEPQKLKVFETEMESCKLDKGEAKLEIEKEGRNTSALNEIAKSNNIVVEINDLSAQQIQEVFKSTILAASEPGPRRRITKNSERDIPIDIVSQSNYRPLVDDISPTDAN